MGMMSTQGTNRSSTGAAEEEDVTICKGTSGTQEGVGEWKPGMAEKAAVVAPPTYCGVL